MRDAVARTAGSLLAAGVQSGDRVAIMAENRIEVVDAWFASAWLGAILVRSMLRCAGRSSSTC